MVTFFPDAAISMADANLDYIMNENKQLRQQQLLFGETWHNVSYHKLTTNHKTHLKTTRYIVGVNGGTCSTGRDMT